MPVMIEDEERYRAGVERRIRRNAAKTRAIKLFAFTEVYPDVVEFLTTQKFKPEGFGELLCSFQDQLNTFGRLSDKQAVVVRRAIARREENKQVRAAERAEKSVTAEWVGTVGERRLFTLTVRHRYSREGQMGTYWVNIMEDSQGNVFIYRGNRWEIGAVVEFKATIKAHDTYQGLKQTVLNRPKVLSSEKVG